MRREGKVKKKAVMTNGKALVWEKLDKSGGWF